MKLGSAIPWALLLSTATLVSTARINGPDECGRVIKDTSGSISNTDRQKNLCTWTILMKPDQKVRMAIPYLNLACGREYVEVFDGLLSASSYGKLCAGAAIVFLSTSNVMTIKYSRISGNSSSPFLVYFYGSSPGSEY
ncbi:major seminal plasma glycoprotein PSP-II [Phacochoerus africanus]|uniref:major seminal plasma glycoprotein PSP-II n=1 Tax=Phacochoerus africanus TaxID=41426 RepID=UPI001FDA0307|nr:major seminal plasma glycoprotein PSP-II [Phacochoerus africanus]